MKRTNPDFLNGVPELLILQLLQRREMHGYEVVQAIRAATGSALEFGEGCIYPILHRLEAQGLLASRQEASSGRRRVVYRLTPAGRKRLVQTTHEWQRVAEAIRQVLEGRADGSPALAT
jgi:PadR family transcriptional regulator PadR